MLEPLPIADVQYNDMIGTCAADWHSGTELHKFAKSKGIDTDRYFPISLRIYGVIPTSFTIYAVDKEIANESYDEIYKYAKENDGILPVVKFRFESDLNELSKFLKRFSTVLTTKMDTLKQFDILDDITLK